MFKIAGWFERLPFPVQVMIAFTGWIGVMFSFVPLMWLFVQWLQYWIP